MELFCYSVLEMTTDTYKTIEAPTVGLYKDKGSKFLAFAYAVGSEEEVKERIATLKKSHHDARHYVSAFCLAGAKGFCRCSDDGEPSNSGGPPVLGMIQSRGLKNVLVVVVRYFGGTKLGVPGLIAAYKGAAQEALGRAEIVEVVEKEIFEVRFVYQAMGEIMRAVKEEGLVVVEQDFAEACRLRLAVRMRDREEVRRRFAEMRNNEWRAC